VLVSSRENNPIFFTPRERGRNLIAGSETVRTFVQSDCSTQHSHPVVGTHPRCVLIAGLGCIRMWKSPLIGPSPMVRTHRGKKQRCVPTTG
jgi:hypothetical protein